MHKLLEAYFGPDWKSNLQLEFYTKLKSNMDNTVEIEPYCEEEVETEIVESV